MDGAAMGAAPLSDERAGASGDATRFLKPLLASVAACAMAAFALLAMPDRTPQQAPEAPAHGAAPGAAARRHAAPCDECGVFESIRLLRAEGSSPPLYEITVRLRDGSAHQVLDATPGPWRVGERIKLIRAEGTAQ